MGILSNEGGTTGGIFGNSNTNCTSENIYYLNTCGGWGTGTNKTAEEMRDPAFVSLLNNNTDVWGFDVDNINDGYPILEGNIMSTIETTAAAMDVYPNPARDNFTVEGTGLLTITNVLGQKVMEKTIEERCVITLPEGMYLLKLTDGNTTATRKVVVY